MEESKSFWAHLEELRGALLRVSGVLLVALIGCFSLFPTLFEQIILAPTSSEFLLYRLFTKPEGILPLFDPEAFSVEIINIRLAAPFLTHISTSFYLALLLIFPYLIFEVWRFVRPGLYVAERRQVGFAFGCGTLMFYLGCAVGYLIVFPLTFRFLADYPLSAQVVNQISLDSYMGNFLSVIFMLGVVFELPLLIWLLSTLGLVNRAWLARYRRHAVVVLLILSAIITPSGDPFTLLVVFLPLYLLYEVGIRFARK